MLVNSNRQSEIVTKYISAWQPKCTVYVTVSDDSSRTEVLRVVKWSGRWTPGHMAGELVPVKGWEEEATEACGLGFLYGK